MAQAPIAIEKMDELGIDGLLALIEAGESLTKIAVTLNVSRRSVANWIAADAGRATLVQQAIEEAAEADDERAIEVLKDERMDVARAREIAQHHRWRAKVKNPRRYGDRQTIDVNHKYADASDEELAAEIAALMQGSAS